MSCSICEGRDINKEGLELAHQEVIPFFKKTLLKLRYPNHPFPLKYDGLLSSIACYSQALLFNRLHSVRGVFYTTNKWMLKFSKELEDKFGMATKHEMYKPEQYYEVCEYNAETTQ